MKAQPSDHELRRLILRALVEHEQLFRLLVLKGGNALALIYDLGGRASLDLDFSLADDDVDAAALGQLMWNALEVGLGKFGLRPFDWKFVTKPKNPPANHDDSWGGYLGTFKIISNQRWDELDGNLRTAQLEAFGTSTFTHSPKRIFRLELSRNEMCKGALVQETSDGLRVQVYTLEMLAAEKLRSLCQQMKEYPRQKTPTPRARDYYDIHHLTTEGGVNLTSGSNRALLLEVFAAKKVPIALIGKLPDYHEFHGQEWPRVQDSIPAARELDFEFYSIELDRLVRHLESLWKNDPPA